MYMSLRVVCTVLSVLPALSASELCTTLSRLESRLLSRGGAEELLSINRRYTEALAAWGWTSLRSADERRCRVSALGEALCRDARAFLPTAPPPSETATSTWANMMAELSAHETNESACARFDQSHVLNWNPPVWGWAGCTRSRIFPANVPPFKRMPELTSAAFAWEYGPSYCDHTAVTVTPQLQEALQVSAAALRRKGAIAAAAAADSRAAQPRLNMTGETTVIVSHFKCLRQSLQLEVASLGALLEFGGGTSGLGALLPHLGFGGVHVVHDLPPMILLQRYWLRHAGVPAYIVGLDLPAEVAATDAGRAMLRGAHALEPAGNRSDLVPQLLHSLRRDATADATGGGSLFARCHGAQLWPVVARVRPVLPRLWPRGHAL